MAWISWLHVCSGCYTVFSVSVCPALQLWEPQHPHSIFYLNTEPCSWKSQSYEAFSVYLAELSVIFQIQIACKRKQCTFLPAGFLKCHVGKSTYHVFHMKRKLSVMTGISECVAASAAVENVTVYGTNQGHFEQNHALTDFGISWKRKKKKAIECLKNRQPFECKCIK